MAFLRSSFFRDNWGHGMLLCLAIALVIATTQSTSSVISASVKAKQLLAPPEHLKLFTFGYHETFSDSLWLRVIQDIDVCGRDLGDDNLSPLMLEPKEPGPPPICKDSWVFHMLNAITTMTPRFRMPYSAGGSILSVVVNDPTGAGVIFDRGVKEFPNDWIIAYKAAYHFLVELNDPAKASHLLVQAGKNGAPYWVFSLAGHLMTETGQALLAKSVLEDAIRLDPEGRFTIRLKQRLEAANKILAESQKKAPASTQ